MIVILGIVFCAVVVVLISNSGPRDTPRNYYEPPTIQDGGDCVGGCSGASARAGNQARMHELREQARWREIEERANELYRGEVLRQIPDRPTRIEVKTPGEEEFEPIRRKK